MKPPWSRICYAGSCKRRGRPVRRAVTAVRLRVGEFAGIEPSLLEDAFRRQSPGTSAEGARLEVVAVLLEALCDSCGHRFRIEQFRFRCPICGGCRTRVVAGEELELESLSVTNDPGPSKAVMS